ncbi:MAG: tRNA lysidine(34) synthetase TilS [Halobacteriovoraceae bacterium]|nr:tRNA lysidine(34) synthetase TilS [Halobacteriovoraceae bacterium]
MLLLLLMAELKSRGLFKEIVAVHIDHGTRAECKAESELVASVCTNLGVPFRSVKLQLNPKASNFEFLAREARYFEFEKILCPGDKLYLGHHIDDSLEWSLMQQFKSGSVIPSLGIPLKRGAVARPFHCLTRKQIRKLALKFELPFLDDSSNMDPRFERNFVRNEILTKVEERFPAYLKHFVHRGNQLALKLAVHCSTNSQENWKGQANLAGGEAILCRSYLNKFEGSEEQIRRTISRLSNQKRGRIGNQVSKLITAQSNGKLGPMNFSGGLKAYMGQGSLLFLSKKDEENYKSLDKKWGEELERKSLQKARIMTLGEIEVLMDGLSFPYLVCGLKSDFENYCPGLKKAHPLLPEYCRVALSKNYWVQSLPKLLVALRNRTVSPENLKILIP